LGAASLPEVTKAELLRDLEAAISKAWSLIERLDELEAEQYPTKSGKALIQALRQLLKSISQELESVYSQLGSETIRPSPALALFCRALSSAVSALHEYVRYVQLARTAVNPWGIPFVIEQIIRDFAPGAKVLLRPQWKYNYSYIELIRMFRTLGPKIQWAVGRDFELTLKKLGSSFIVLSFPTCDRDSALRLCLLFHEAGHFVHDILDLSRHVVLSLPRGLIDELVNSVIKSGRRPPAIPLDEFLERDRIEAKITKELAEWALRWVKELVADLFALSLLGPAYFLAFCELTVGQSDLDEPSRFHPPLRIRLGLMIDEMERKRVRQKPVDSALRRRIASIRRRLAACPKKEQGLEVQIVERAVESALDQIILAVDGATAKRQFTINDKMEEIRALIERMWQRSL